MKILVVDDEKDMELLFLQRFRKEIRKNEFEFAFAFSGEQALQYLREHARDEALILSDINMPGMSGLELLKYIKEIDKLPPAVVVMVTAYDDEENRTAAEELGADGFLTKPIDFNSLKDTLREIA